MQTNRPADRPTSVNLGVGEYLDLFAVSSTILCISDLLYAWTQSVKSFFVLFS